jgi:hypothetical protein
MIYLLSCCPGIGWGTTIQDLVLDFHVSRFNPETTGRPFCGFQMSSNVAGGRKKTICHPRFPVQLSWTLPVHVQVKNPSLRCSSIFG